MIGKYNPKALDSEANVNAPDTSPLKDFVLILAAVGVFFFGAYIVLGFLVQIVLERYEPEASSYLATLFKPEISSDPKSELARTKLQELVDELATELPGPKRDYIVHLREEPTVNALAFPGGHIVVYRGLLNTVRSENELSMILAHELGHFAGKDHMQGLGRALVFIVIAVALTGQESYVTSLLGEALEGSQGRFSKIQELQADAFALTVLQKKYGHVGGAKDFFLRLAEEENILLFELLSSTHPLSSARVEALEDLTKEKGYEAKETTPLSLHYVLN